MRADAEGLARALADGDQEAFREVYLSNVQVVYRVCAGRLGAEEAEDAVSLVFLEVWRLRARAVQVDGSMLPWVLAIAGNCLRDVRRSRRRHASRLERFHARREVAAPDLADAVAAGVDAAAQSAVVHGLVAAMPDPYGYVARRCLLKEATPAAVAFELGANPSTVRGQLGVARARICAELRRRGEPSDGAGPGGHLPVRRPTDAGAQLEGSRT